MEQRFRLLDAWGYVLILLLIALMIIAFLGDQRWGVAIAALVMAQTALLIFRAGGVPRSWFRWMQVLAAVAVVATAVAYATTVNWTDTVAGIIILVLLLVSPVVIARRIRDYTTVTLSTVYAVICIFIILGMFYGVLYQVIDQLTPNHFFGQMQDARAFDYLYFSFVTLTTLGYGDLTPAGDVGKSIAIIEALNGQLYLVTIVALVVTNLGRERRERSRPTDWMVREEDVEGRDS